MEKTIYQGTLKFKFVESNHSYWIAEKQKDGWGSYKRITGSTTFGNIKDKSVPLKYWVAKIMAKFLHEILCKRGINKYDIDKAKKLHTDKLQEAATTGSKVHDWIEEYIRKKNPEMPEEKNVLIGVNAFLDWVKENRVNFTEAEEPVYSKKYGYCGTLDAVAIIKGKRYLVDYKTGTGLYNDVMLQTASYVKGYEEMRGIKVYGRWTIRLEKRTEKEFKADMDEKGKPNAKYVSFEAINLDLDPTTGKHDKNLVDEDFAGFLYAKGLYDWDKKSGNRMSAYKKKGEQEED